MGEQHNASMSIGLPIYSSPNLFSAPTLPHPPPASLTAPEAFPLGSPAAAAAATAAHAPAQLASGARPKHAGAQMARQVEQLEQRVVVQNQQQASVVDGVHQTSEGWPGMRFPWPPGAVPGGVPAPAAHSQAAGRVAMTSGNFQQQLDFRAPRRLVKGLPESDMQSFTCPITHAVIWDPVIASDGYTCEPLLDLIRVPITCDHRVPHDSMSDGASEGVAASSS
ncbi:hypothetical protein ABBQ38_010975 [Trebouxia sp. C0009 RCD-2024]